MTRYPLEEAWQEFWATLRPPVEVRAVEALLAAADDAADPNRICPVCQIVLNSRDHDEGGCVIAEYDRKQRAPLIEAELS